MQQTPTINIKRGNVFSYAGFVEIPAGNWTAASSIKDIEGTLIYQLQVTFTPPAVGDICWNILLYAPSTDTFEWPLGNSYADIEFQSVDNPDLTLYSPTFVVNVVEEITNV